MVIVMLCASTCLGSPMWYEQVRLRISVKLCMGVTVSGEIDIKGFAWGHHKRKVHPRPL